MLEPLLLAVDPTCLICLNGFSYQSYTDDPQLYMLFEPSDSDKISNCPMDTRALMQEHRLQLSFGKIELLVFLARSDISDGVALASFLCHVTLFSIRIIRLFLT